MAGKVKFPSENPLGDLEGVVFGDPSRHPRGLIVLHEWWGMNEQIQAKGAQIAQEGDLTVLVLDLYRGKVAIDREEAGHYMAGLNWDGAVQDLTAGAIYLKKIGCTKVGITGFCLGGALAFAAAVRCPEISAAAPFYGIPRGTTYDLTKIHIPVQAHFGEKDDAVGFSSPADYEPLNDLLVGAGVPYEMYTYPTGHAFTNNTNPNYSPELTKLAFERVYDFMHKHLQ